MNIDNYFYKFAVNFCKFDNIYCFLAIKFAYSANYKFVLYEPIFQIDMTNLYSPFTNRYDKKVSRCYKKKSHILSIKNSFV